MRSSTVYIGRFALTLTGVALACFVDQDLPRQTSATSPETESNANDAGSLPEPTTASTSATATDTKSSDSTPDSTTSAPEPISSTSDSTDPATDDTIDPTEGHDGAPSIEECLAVFDDITLAAMPVGLEVIRKGDRAPNREVPARAPFIVEFPAISEGADLGLDVRPFEAPEQPVISSYDRCTPAISDPDDVHAALHCGVAQLGDYCVFLFINGVTGPDYHGVVGIRVTAQDSPEEFSCVGETEVSNCLWSEMCSCDGGVSTSDSSDSSDSSTTGMTGMTGDDTSDDSGPVITTLPTITETSVDPVE